jgi:hypothetical protein
MYRIKWAAKNGASQMLKQNYMSLSAATKALEKVKEEHSHLDVEFFIVHKMPGTNEWI